jgi:hypothetical protein
MEKDPHKGKRPNEPPGGRALERLHQFEQERGLEPTEVPDEEPEERSDRKPSATGKPREEEEEEEDQTDDNR